MFDFVSVVDTLRFWWQRAEMPFGRKNARNSPHEGWADRQRQSSNDGSEEK